MSAYAATPRSARLRRAPRPPFGYPETEAGGWLPRLRVGPDCRDRPVL